MEYGGGVFRCVICQEIVAEFADEMPIDLETDFIDLFDLCFDKQLQEEIQRNAMVCNRCSNEIIKEETTSSEIKIFDENQNLRSAEIKECLLDGSKVFSCKFEGCIYSTSTKRSIEDHQKMHYEQKFNCGVCGKILENSELYSIHMNHHNKIKNNYYTCDLCDFKALKKSDIKRHVLEKRLNTKILCDHCGKFFGSTSSLKKHLEVNQQSCNLCNYTSNSTSKMKRHQRTHSKEKSFCCDICGLAFRHSYNINAHKKLKHVDKI